MQVTYDAEADAVSITLLADVPRAKTVQVRRGILVHFDAQDRLLELEILQARAQYPPATLERLGSPVEYLTLAQAAKETGLDASTLRRQILNKRLQGEKRGHDWLVTRAALWTYLDSRAPSGRPARRKKARRPRRAPAPKSA
jgi:excisionase family DNA binding protein